MWQYSSLVLEPAVELVHRYQGNEGVGTSRLREGKASLCIKKGSWGGVD